MVTNSITDKFTSHAMLCSSPLRLSLLVSNCSPQPFYGTSSPFQLFDGYADITSEVINKKVRKYSTFSSQLTSTSYPLIKELSNNKSNQLPNIKSGLGASFAAVRNFVSNWFSPKEAASTTYETLSGRRKKVLNLSGATK